MLTSLSVDRREKPNLRLAPPRTPPVALTESLSSIDALQNTGNSAGKTFKQRHLLLRIGCASPSIYDYDLISTLYEGRYICDFQRFVRSGYAVPGRAVAADFDASNFRKGCNLEPVDLIRSGAPTIVRPKRKSPVWRPAEFVARVA
jgi:hypothetical protein